MAGLAASPPGLPARRGNLFSPLARHQYAALIWLQTRFFVNGLRSRRGSFEVGAQIVSALVFGLIAFGPAVGIGFGAWVGVAQARPLAIAMLLWVLCVMWQFFSVMAPALAGQNPDLTHLLRFPVSYGSWILLYLVYGLSAPSTLIGMLWTLAIGIGITIARPDQIGWTFLTLALFGLFNLLCSRMLLAWIGRWLAQRRTREIVSGALLFIGLGAQTLNPAFHLFDRGSMATHHRRMHLPPVVLKSQAFLPPGLALTSIEGTIHHRPGQRTEALASLAGCVLLAGSLLALRLRGESRGENFSEIPHSKASARPRVRKATRSWLDLSGPVGGIFAKDLRYLLRSGPMLYNLAAPLVMAVLFGGAMRSGSAYDIRSSYALPLGLVWAFLGLIRLVSNSFGIDGEGIRLYYLSPTPLRTVVISKNLLHLTLFLVEAAIISLVVQLRFGPPTPAVAAATLAWLLFAIPANLGMGNLLSIKMPYRANLVRMRREPGALGNGLLSMLLQFGIVLVGAGVVVPCALLEHPWFAPPILLVFAAASCIFYMAVLQRVDRLLLSVRDAMIGQIAKTSPTG